MALAMAAADLAVTRAGASTLGELPAANLPAVIVPLQLSDQAVNARYLADQGAATIVNSDDVGQLVDTVLAILESDEQLSSMRTAMTALNQPDAAGRLAALLREMGQRQGVA
jgi:UDP-N-acetylglucosamine--N-acetylmuramyl-(pentapeptide) pyrophosphoryl-undecaprenol N-acetylglucosamine transferase